MIPQTLPILPLSNYVLLPSIVTTLNVCPSEGQDLLRHMSSASSYFVCVPFKGNKKHRSNSVDLSELFHYGCVAQVLDCDKSIPDQYAIRVKGVCSSRIRDISNSDGGNIYEALLEHHFDKEDSVIQTDEAIIFNSLCQIYMSKLRLIGVSCHVLDQFNQLLTKSHVSHVANLLMCLTDSSLGDKLRTLEAVDVKQRLHQVHHAVSSYLQTINTSAIKRKGDEMIFDHLRRKFYILQELHSLDINDDAVDNTSINPSHFEICSEDDDEIIDLVTKLNANTIPEHAVVSIKRDLNRLRKLPSNSADSAILRTYLEYISDLPWALKEDALQQQQQCELNLNSVRDQLDADHFGIDQVKKRILEYMSVLKMKKDARPPIICFVGPPGVGKTTLGKSIAVALNRKFHRLSLGGVRDEAEIRGHRRTYVGALPGILIHGMRQCGVQNPLFLLDEIDKLVTNSNQGDPAAALLEVLDPAQNGSFTDHFINIPYDLSQVLFIATANSLDTIPRPLLDRMEVVQLDGYTFNEKLHIATTHLIPKQIDAHGMSFLGLQIPENVVLHLAERYTRESGVRGLERMIANICRYKCREYADLEESGRTDRFERTIHVHELESILGAEPFENDVVADSEEDTVPGIVTGLAYSGSGNGGIMMIEANHMPGTGRLNLTGSLGDVIKESAQLAVSWVKANAFALKLTHSPKQDVFQDLDLHIHMPSGAVPKDGPSAGITIATCLVSLLSGNGIPNTTAMTGEVTLRGQVRPVGGIKEKVVSAHRAGIKKILLPVANRRDVIKDIPTEVKNEMTFVYCKSMWDVIESAFDQSNIRFEPRFASSL